MLLVGRTLAHEVKKNRSPNSLSEVEFSVFSQFGDDGIIQWLLGNLAITNQTFIEFGVGKYRESNTRFLLMNNNWSGFIIDSSADNIELIKSENYFWRHDLQAIEAFVTTENVSYLIAKSGFKNDIGILHIDVDGCDYWLWKALEEIKASVVIMEYNSVFGFERSFTVPYRADFNRTKAHFSNLYFGASLRAFGDLATEKGYGFVGCNTAGNNAYFVRRELLNSTVQEVSLYSGFVESKFRESRDLSGNLSFLRSEERIEVLRGMPVVNTRNGMIEEI